MASTYPDLNKCAATYKNSLRKSPGDVITLHWGHTLLAPRVCEKK